MNANESMKWDITTLIMKCMQYHENYYLIHKDEMNRMQKERYRNRKNNNNELN